MMWTGKEGYGYCYIVQQQQLDSALLHCAIAATRFMQPFRILIPPSTLLVFRPTHFLCNKLPAEVCLHGHLGHSHSFFRYVLNSAFSDGCGKTSLLSLQETAYPSLLPDIALAPDIISSNIIPELRNVWISKFALLK